MKKKKTLNYRFHNPNSDKAAAEYLIKIFMEANLKKVEQAMQTAMKTQQASSVEEGASECGVPFSSAVICDRIE